MGANRPLSTDATCVLRREKTLFCYRAGGVRRFAMQDTAEQSRAKDMRFFKGVKDTYKKSEAAVVVQNLLTEAASMGMFDKDPAKVANALVGEIWEMMPEVLRGDLGVRPHKITLAAMAFGGALKMDEATDVVSDSHVFAFCLSRVLAEAQQRAAFYQLNFLDQKLLKSALEVFQDFASASESSPIAQEIDLMLGGQQTTWDAWYRVFTNEAVAHNPLLKIGETGGTFFDMVEHEPLQRAFRDGVDPKLLGQQQAKHFDGKEIIATLTRRG